MLNLDQVQLNVFLFITMRLDDTSISTLHMYRPNEFPVSVYFQGGPKNRRSPWRHQRLRALKAWPLFPFLLEEIHLMLLFLTKSCWLQQLPFPPGVRKFPRMKLASGTSALNFRSDWKKITTKLINIWGINASWYASAYFDCMHA